MSNVCLTTVLSLKLFYSASYTFCYSCMLKKFHIQNPVLLETQRVLKHNFPSKSTPPSPFSPLPYISPPRRKAHPNETLSKCDPRANFRNLYCDMNIILFTHHVCFYRNNVQHVPVVLAGDFNGCPGDAVYNYVVENGFISSYKTVHNKEPCVTHRVYNGDEILVDYIFYR